MKYDFDRVINRSASDSAKWNASAIFGDSDVLPMWVADMDFPIAKPITEAIRKRAEHEVYGYGRVPESLLQAIVDRMRAKYNWKIESEWVVFTPGVVPALNAAIRAFAHPGDEVVIQDPVYHPFWSAVEQSGCCVTSNPMRLVDGRYHLDIDDLEAKFGPKEGMRRGPSRARVMILCSPHNPTGRVWTEDELKAAGDIAIRHGAVVVSDEVHCELLYRGVRHTPFATISKDFEQNCIVCQAGSKTFNLAGLPASTIIIPNPRLREQFQAARIGILPPPDVFGFVALEAAYREGDDWLAQALAYIQGNLDFMVEFVEKRIPRLSVVKPEGTYLVWLDCRRLGMDDLTLRAFFRGKAKVGLDDGRIFGPAGSGFERINIACPRSTLEEGLSRIERAVNSLT